MAVTSPPAASRAAVAQLQRRRRAWFARRLLRSAYNDAWRELAPFAAAGPSLEVGCGCGNLDGVLPRCWRSDILPLPWADLAADALRLPVRSGALANLVATDVLHHLPRPLDFLAEAARALRPGGRLLLIEPYMSLVSYPLYRFLHPEAAEMRGDAAHLLAPNQAVATLLFVRPPAVMAARVPQLEVIHCRARDIIVYPLSGGYSYPALLPGWLERWAWRAERRLAALAPMVGFRLAVALRRREGP